MSSDCLIDEILEAKKEADEELGFETDFETALKCLVYCKRKLAYIKKEEDYLPVLFRYELVNWVNIEYINSLGRKNAERRKSECLNYQNAMN